VQKKRKQDWKPRLKQNVNALQKRNDVKLRKLKRKDYVLRLRLLRQKLRDYVRKRKKKDYVLKLKLKLSDFV